MKTNITVVTKRTYNNGTTTETSGPAAEIEEKEINKSNYSEENLLNTVPKELLDYAKQNFPENFAETSLRYMKGNSSFVFEFLSFSAFGSFKRNVYLTTNHISVEETSIANIGNHDDNIKIDNIWYIIFKDGKFIYIPRDYSINHFKANGLNTKIETNFEGGWNHSFASVGSLDEIASRTEGGKLTTMQRYVGSNNEDPTIYADIKSEYDKDYRLIKETKTHKFFMEDAPGDTVVEECDEYIYEEEK